MIATCLVMWEHVNAQLRRPAQKLGVSGIENGIEY